MVFRISFLVLSQIGESACFFALESRRTLRHLRQQAKRDPARAL